MIEIVLDRAEFLVLMDAVHAPAVFGLRLEQLLPVGEAERHNLYQRGQSLLEQRGLLRRSAEGVCRIDGMLLLMAAVVAFPQLASMTTHKHPLGHEQSWMHAYSDGLVVEHSLLDAGHHRLMTLPGPTSLAARLLDLWPATKRSDPGMACVIPGVTLAAIARLIDNNQPDVANKTLAQFDIPMLTRVRLLNTLRTKTLSGNIALLRCQGQEIIRAHNLGLIAGPRATWLATQPLPGSPSLQLECVAASELRKRIVDCLEDLYPLQSTA